MDDHPINRIYLTVLISILWLNGFAQDESKLVDNRDGKIYGTVKIGEQIWMSENLSYRANFENQEVKKHMKSYFIDTVHNKNGEEIFYNWPAAQSVCPVGWHLPTESDFDALINSSGGNSSDAYKNLIDGGSSGFQAKLVGYVSVSINSKIPLFEASKKATIFWFNPNISSNPKIIYPPCLIFTTLKKVKKSSGYIEDTYSVRCVKD